MILQPLLQRNFFSSQILLSVTGSGDLRIDDEANEEELEGSYIGKPT
jgi:hypothetical protein